MTIFFRALLLAGLVTALPLRAVYAPIPEQDQGKDLVLSLRAGVSHDSNVFGAASGEVSSAIWTLAPRATYNASVTDQTFLSAAYGLTFDHFVNRPGDKSLDSHDALARLAHAFSKATTLDIQDQYTIARNPEALLAGVPLNADQSYDRNQFDARFTTALNAKATATVKARSIFYDYRNAALGREIDRTENLYGVAVDHAFLPEVKLVGEVRHQDVYYRKLGELKNKRSNYLMGGIDYAVARKLSLSSRLGAEWRSRAGEQDTTAPYAEFSGKYDYSRASYLAGGYAYTLEEVSDPVRFTDTRVHRFFVSLQHSLTPLIVASVSATFEPSELQGRRGQPDISEDTSRVGAALSYLPTKNWVVSAHFDHDRVSSGDASRKLRRERVGLGVQYSF